VKTATGVVAGVLLMLASAHAHDPITTRVTWNGEIARIVGSRCVSCHSPAGRGPMSLETYDDARPWAKAIKEEVMTRRMPKWHAVRGYGDFANDPSLSSFEIALITAWADGGAPRGSDAPTGRNAAGDPSSRNRVDEAGGRSPRDRTPTTDPTLRKSTLRCGERPLPPGLLFAVQPDLDKDGSIGIAVRMPDGRREIVAWVRGYDPDFPTTYWLRSPLALPPGSALTTEPPVGCSVIVTLKPRR
jgi:hypothetical protein